MTGDVLDGSHVTCYRKSHENSNNSHLLSSQSQLPSLKGKTRIEKEKQCVTIASQNPTVGNGSNCTYIVGKFRSRRRCSSTLHMGSHKQHKDRTNHGAFFGVCASQQKKSGDDGESVLPFLFAMALARFCDFCSPTFVFYPIFAPLRELPLRMKGRFLMPGALVLQPLSTCFGYYLVYRDIVYRG